MDAFSLVLGALRFHLSRLFSYFPNFLLSSEKLLLPEPPWVFGTINAYFILEACTQI